MFIPCTGVWRRLCLLLTVTLTFQMKMWAQIIGNISNWASFGSLQSSLLAEHRSQFFSAQLGFVILPDVFHQRQNVVTSLLLLLGGCVPCSLFVFPLPLIPQRIPLWCDHCASLFSGWMAVFCFIFEQQCCHNYPGSLGYVRVRISSLVSLWELCLKPVLFPRCHSCPV